MIEYLIGEVTLPILLALVKFRVPTNVCLAKRKDLYGTVDVTLGCDELHHEYYDS